MEAWPPGGKQQPLNPLTVLGPQKKQRFPMKVQFRRNVPSLHSWLTRQLDLGRWEKDGKMEELDGISELHPKSTSQEHSFG